MAGSMCLGLSWPVHPRSQMDFEPVISPDSGVIFVDMMSMGKLVVVDSISHWQTAAEEGDLLTRKTCWHGMESTSHEWT